MPIGFGVSLRVNDETVDPAPLLAAVEPLLQRHSIDVDQGGHVVRFAAEPDALAELAAPLAQWWQSAGPHPAGQVSLRFVGPNGVTELQYCRPDVAIAHVRHYIVAESGPFYGPGEAPGPMRRLAARVLRGARTGFTATTLCVEVENGLLVVTLAGRDLDDEPHEVQLQGPDEDDDYCLVNETHIPVPAGLAALRLSRTALHLRLTAGAARAWGLRSTRMTIRLNLTQPLHDELHGALRRLFTDNADRWPSLDVDLGDR